MKSCSTCENKTVSFSNRGNVVVHFSDHDFTISPERILNNLIRTEEGRARLSIWSEKEKQKVKNGQEIES
jgi:hypothetical protein